ncbi:glycosyltransferase [Lacticaseibacillus hulanensis]|uniref:glycosyltransferase n=1 Tax=Lacticaseibacillus hulanensis TaxID=2493111 RepID=UPI000FD85671|nr:glycosyltransferase [Lacticaseibacillus hulanensis]
MITFSIIVPMYNSEKTLPRLINSITECNETEGIELIFVDDGSNDDSVETVKRMCNSKISFQIISQTHEFQSAARNKGICVAKGKFILFCDSDDEYASGFFDELRKASFEKKLVWWNIEKKYNRFCEVEKPSFLKSLSGNEKKDVMVNRYLTQNNESDVGLWNKRFDKKVIQDNGIRFENGNFFEDSLFILKYLLVIEAKEIVSINKVGYYLYRNNVSTTQEYNPQISILARDYIRKTSQVLEIHGIPNKTSFRAFEDRTMIHVIHHFIKYDPDFSVTWLRQYAKSRLFWGGFFKLPPNYVFALCGLKLLPSFYVFLYKRKFN